MRKKKKRRSVYRKGRKLKESSKIKKKRRVKVRKLKVKVRKRKQRKVYSDKKSCLGTREFGGITNGICHRCADLEECEKQYTKRYGKYEPRRRKKKNVK